MKNLQKMGGIAALIGAATNLLALVVFAVFLVLKGLGSTEADHRMYVRSKFDC